LPMPHACSNTDCNHGWGCPLQQHPQNLDNLTSKIVTGLLYIGLLCAIGFIGWCEL
jgi:hypothetical protein